MNRIEFSEMTNRLHRNLMLIAALIILMIGFDIKVGKAAMSGLELENLTTSVLLVALVAVLIYHAFAFGIRAFEEYRLWELKLADKQGSVWGGGPTIFELIDQMKGAGESLEKVIQNTGSIHHKDQEILTESHARQIMDAAKSALIYGKRFDNFPTITRVRFWLWDIGISVAVTILASLFAFWCFQLACFVPGFNYSCFVYPRFPGLS